MATAAGRIIGGMMDGGGITPAFDPTKDILGSGGPQEVLYKADSLPGAAAGAKGIAPPNQGGGLIAQWNGPGPSPFGAATPIDPEPLPKVGTVTNPAPSGGTTPTGDKQGIPGPDLGPLAINPDGTISHHPSGSSTPAPTPGSTPPPTGDTPPATGGTPSTTPNPSNNPTLGGTTWSDPPEASNSGVPDVPKLTDPGRSADKQALIDQLKAKAGQSTLIDPNDPNIKGQTDAFRAEQIRAARSATADAAEQNSPYNTGQQAGIARMEQEKVGQNVGQFESTLMGKELESRRAEIQHAMDSMGGLLTDEEKNGLQRELANLNAAIEQSKSSTQNQQFYAGLNQQDQQFVSQLQQGERFHNSDDAFNRMKLAQEQSQFVSKLAQEGKIADMQNALEQSKLTQQDKQFILQLAQQGKYADIEAAYKKAALAQDQNQFLAKLAQTGQMAQADDLFRRMQLAQQQSQFLDRLGLDADQQKAYWEWVQRGNGAPPSQ